MKSVVSERIVVRIRVQLTPMRVDDEEGTEDGVGHRGRPNEGHDERGNLRGRNHLCVEKNRW